MAERFRLRPIAMTMAGALLILSGLYYFGIVHRAGEHVLHTAGADTYNSWRISFNTFQPSVISACAWFLAGLAALHRGGVIVSISYAGVAVSYLCWTSIVPLWPLGGHRSVITEPNGLLLIGAIGAVFVTAVACAAVLAKRYVILRSPGHWILIAATVSRLVSFYAGVANGDPLASVPAASTAIALAGVAPAADIAIGLVIIIWGRAQPRSRTRSMQHPSRTTLV